MTAVLSEAEISMVQRFGTLSLTMLNDTPLTPVWRLSFAINFYLAPLYRDLAEAHGLSRPEFVVMFCLLQKPGLVARDVCLVTGLPKNSISRAVASLASKSLIEKQESRSDKRATPLVLTGQGTALVKEIIPGFASRQQRMREALTATELAEFDRLMKKMVYALPGWVGKVG